MPKEFGDWLGEQPTLNFDDPGNWVPPPKKKGAPPVSEKPHTAAFIELGFKFDLKKSEWVRLCSTCERRGIFIRQMVSGEYLDYCNKNFIDPRICSCCQP